MNPAMPMLNPMMPYGSGLTPQPVQNTNRLFILEEQQRQQHQHQAQLANTGLLGTSWETPQFFHYQTVVGWTTTALPGNTLLYNTPLTPMTPITPATPASESSGIVPQLQNIVSTVNMGCQLDLRTIGLRDRNVEYNPKGAMNPAMPIFNPMMPYGSGLTPQPVQNTNRLFILEEQQRQQHQHQAQLANTGLPGTSWQTPQFFHYQSVVGSTTTALPGNTPLYNTPLTPMAPITPATPASESAETVLQLQNIVSSVNLGCQLDLKTIGLRGRNVEYNPKHSPAVIMRIRKPRTTALIFRSGKLVCTGAKSTEESRIAARRFARLIQKLDFPTKFLNFKIQNMVGSWNVKFPIRLEGLVLKHQKCSSYEPELFPGLTYRMVKPRLVLLIFASGKVVLTGAKKITEIYEAFENIYPILKAFRRTT